LDLRLALLSEGADRGFNQLNNLMVSSYKSVFSGRKRKGKYLGSEKYSLIKEKESPSRPGA